jgi:hypothetical protein
MSACGTPRRSRAASTARNRFRGPRPARGATLRRAPHAGPARACSRSARRACVNLTLPERVASRPARGTDRLLALPPPPCARCCALRGAGAARACGLLVTGGRGSFSGPATTTPVARGFFRPRDRLRLRHLARIPHALREVVRRRALGCCLPVANCLPNGAAAGERACALRRRQASQQAGEPPAPLRAAGWLAAGRDPQPSARLAAHCPLPTAHCPLPTAHCPLTADRRCARLPALLGAACLTAGAAARRVACRRCCLAGGQCAAAAGFYRWAAAGLPLASWCLAPGAVTERAVRTCGDSWHKFGTPAPHTGQQRAAVVNRLPLSNQ